MRKEVKHVQVDANHLEQLLEHGTKRYFCRTEGERIAFLTALDSLGYRWQSSDPLLFYNSPSYTIHDEVYGIRYTVNVDRKSVTYLQLDDDSMGYEEGFQVSELLAPEVTVNLDAFLTLLEGGA